MSKNQLVRLALVTCLITLAGCSQKPAQRTAPPTYPVTGKVTSPEGRSLAGGCVEFKPKQNESELTATGVIDDSGRFTLQIPFVDRVIPGATEGPHNVFVMMPLGTNRKGGDYVPIKGMFNVKPIDNQFEITLPATRR